MKFIRDEFGDYFCIGVGGYPESWNGSYNDDLINLKNKIEAGADMVKKIFSLLWTILISPTDL